MPIAGLSIATYDGLVAAVGDWLNRADLTDQIPVFVQLAEAQFNREIRTRDMHVRTEAISQQEFVPLPGDFLQQYSMALRPSGSGNTTADLKYISKKQADTYKARGLIGPVLFYTLTDNAFELIPAPTANQDLIMVYYARIPTLGEPLGLPPPSPLNRQTNWLITRSPDLYLASSILQSAPYLNDQARLQTWAQLRGEIMGNMAMENEYALRSMTQLTARAEPF